MMPAILLLVVFVACVVPSLSISLCRELSILPLMSYSGYGNNNLGEL